MRENLRKKRNFSELEAETLASEVEGNKEVLFGSTQTGVKRAHKSAVWGKITAAVNSVAVEERTPAEVKKKWSDLKLATKRHVAALKRGSAQAGGGQADPSLPLSPTEEKIASIIGSELVSVVGSGDGGGGGGGGGGDTGRLAAKPEESGNRQEARSPPQGGDGAAKPEPVPQQATEHGRAPSAAPRPLFIMAELLERQTEMCHLLATVVTSLEAINNTLKQINDNIKK